MHIGYVPQERPPFSALNFRSGAYNFHKFPKNPFRSITILHFFGDFAVPETIIFKISNYIPFIASHGRLSPNAAPRVSQTRPGSSGESHFHAKNGSSSFQSPPPPPPPLSRSTGSSFRSPCQFFTLPRNIPTKIWVESPPPPPPPGGGVKWSLTDSLRKSLWSCKSRKNLFYSDWCSKCYRLIAWNNQFSSK